MPIPRTMVMPSPCASAWRLLLLLLLLLPPPRRPCCYMPIPHSPSICMYERSTMVLSEFTAFATSPPSV